MKSQKSLDAAVSSMSLGGDGIMDRQSIFLSLVPRLSRKIRESLGTRLYISGVRV